MLPFFLSLVFPASLVHVVMERITKILTIETSTSLKVFHKHPVKRIATIYLNLFCKFAKSDTITFEFTRILP